MHPGDDEAPSRFPKAPSQAAWDGMSPSERARVVSALPPGLTEEEWTLPEGDRHQSAKLSALDVLRRHFRGAGRRAYVGSELTVYYPDERRFAPDVFVTFDVDPHPREKWVVSDEGRGLDWVMEVHVGGQRKKDAERNVAFYARLGIPEYFICDRRRERIDGYRLIGEKRIYEPIPPQAGGVHSAVLGMDLMLVGDRLRFYFAEQPLFEADEFIDHFRRAIAQTEQRVDEEARRADEAETRLAALQAELEALKKSR